jgi:two-component system sensor histidine kinase UhpB
VGLGTIERETRRQRRTEERRWNFERIIAAQDEERRRISRELHDEAGQALAALVVRLRALEDAPSLREAKAQAALLRKGLADTIGGLARLARGLHPSLLDDLGLGTALKRHAADTAEALDIPIRVRTQGLGSHRLPGAVEMALYRIAQEALTNVARHAGATRVEVTLVRRGASVRLVVADDGRGFDALARRHNTHSARSLGIVGIRERVAALGGSAEITATPGRGATVTVTLPLPARRSAAPRRRRTPRRRVR